MNEAALYFQPFTMPDGSTRRPLFERCEAMRPAQFATRLIYRNPNDGPGLLMDHRDEFGEQVLTEHYHRAWIDEIAAALCRCAVEDWLRRDEATEIRLCCDNPDPTDENPQCAVEYCDYATYSDIETYRGPTIHHALIEAAHSVLDSQGVSP